MTKKEAFFHLIGLLDRTDVRYALVGNVDDYPDHIESDVDIVTDAEGMRRFHRAIWTLEEHGLRVVQRFQHEITAFYYILAFQTEKGGWDFLQPDICTDYYRHARKLMDAVPMLARRRSISCAGCPNDVFYVLSEADEFIYYLLKKIGKKSLSVEQFAHLRRSFAADPDVCCAMINQFPAIAKTVIAAMESDDPDSLSSTLPDLKTQLLRSGSLGQPRRFRDAIRKLSRILHPTGFVAVLPGAFGPNRAFAARLHSDLFHAFRRQSDFSTSQQWLFFHLAKARTTSTFAILDGIPCGLSRLLVDARLSLKEDCTSTILDLLATRAKSCCRPVET